MSLPDSSRHVGLTLHFYKNSTSERCVYRSMKSRQLPSSSCHFRNDSATASRRTRLRSSPRMRSITRATYVLAIWGWLFTWHGKAKEPSRVNIEKDVENQWVRNMIYFYGGFSKFMLVNRVNPSVTILGLICYVAIGDPAKLAFVQIWEIK